MAARFQLFTASNPFDLTIQQPERADDTPNPAEIIQRITPVRRNGTPGALRLVKMRSNVRRLAKFSIAIGADQGDIAYILNCQRCLAWSIARYLARKALSNSPARLLKSHECGIEAYRQAYLRTRTLTEHYESDYLLGVIDAAILWQ